MLRQALLLVVLALLPAIGQAVYYHGRVSWDKPAVAKDEVELAQAQAWGTTVLWVDARPDAQFQQAHIPNAISLNEDRWSELLPDVISASLGKRVVVYCSSQSCAASHEVARRLRDEAGMPDVFVLHGGWETWLESKQ